MNEHDMNILWPYFPGNVPRGRATASRSGGPRPDRIQTRRRQAAGRPDRPMSNHTRPQAGAPGSITLARSHEFGPYSWRYFRIKVEVVGGIALIPPSGSSLSGQVTQESLSAEISRDIREDVSLAATVDLDSDAYQELGEALNNSDPSRFGRVLADNLSLTAALDLNPATIAVVTQYDEHLCFWSIQFTDHPRLIRLRDSGRDVHCSAEVVVSFGPTEEVYRQIAQRIGGQTVRSAIQRWVSRQLTAQAVARLLGALQTAGILALATVSTSAIVTIGFLTVLEDADRRGRRQAALSDYALGYSRRVFSEQPGFPRYPPQFGVAAHGWIDAQQAIQRSGNQVRSTLIRNFAQGLDVTNDRSLPTFAERFRTFMEAHHDELSRYLRRRDSQRNAG